MSACSIGHQHLLRNGFPFGEGHISHNIFLLEDGSSNLQPTAAQSSEELKRTKNRLAQRKHRQRKKASGEQGSFDSFRESRRRSLSTSNCRAGRAQKETTNGRPQNFGRDMQSYSPDLFREQEPRNGQFEGTAAPITSNRNHIPAMIDELDFSLLGEPNDMFDSNQPVESAQSLSPQYYPPSTAGPSTASPFFGTKSPNILGQQFRRQSFGGRMLVHCKCCPQSDISPGALPSQCPGASRQHQMPTPQELPLEQQNIGHQLTAAASDMEQQEWPSDRADLIRVKSTDSHISASVPGRFTTNTHIDTPIESASSSSTKSPLLPVPSALPNSQPAPNHNPAPNSHPPTTQSNPNPELEARFERILDTVEEAGFDSIDSMGSCYYTTTFSPNSICASTQSMSRRRHLRKFLEDISESARGWNAQEAQGYHEGITRSAVNVYVEELGWLKDAGWGGGDGPAKRDEGVRKIRDAVLNEDMMGLLRDEKRFLRDRIPESWSLLTELARSAGLSQPQSSQAACVFLCILMTG